MAKNPNATEGTYSAAPFITYDGIDSDGVRAEVSVVVGYGDVDEVEDSKAGKTKKVSFQVSNTTWGSSGWTRSPKLQAMIEEAQETNEPIHFRVETRRKDGIDRTKPFKDLDSSRGAEIVKSLAALKFEGDTEWTVSDDAVTRIDEDPSNGRSVNANQQSIDQLRPSAGESRSDGGSNGRNSAFEPAPYVAVWRGEINPGTIGVSVPLNFLSNLMEYERESGVKIDKERRKEVALVLLRIANALQKDIYVKFLKADYAGVDLTAGSHTRARALIFEVMRSFFPISDEIVSNDEEFKNWQRNIYNTAYGMWVWAIESVDEFIK